MKAKSNKNREAVKSFVKFYTTMSIFVYGLLLGATNQESGSKVIRYVKCGFIAASWPVVAVVVAIDDMKSGNNP